MPAYVPVPWLNNSDQFMHAITAGSQLGIEKARLREAARAGQGHFNAQFFPPGYGSPSVLDQAHLDLIKAQTQDELAQAEAHKNPYHVLSTGQGEIVRVNPMTGESQVILDPRAHAPFELKPDQVLTQGRELLGIIGDPTKFGARASALENYKALQKQYPQYLSPYQEPKPIAPPTELNNASPFGWFGIPSLMHRIFGGGETPAANTNSAGRFKIETVQ